MYANRRYPDAQVAEGTHLATLDPQFGLLFSHMKASGRCHSIVECGDMSV